MFETEARISYYRARYYDTATGRFWTEDPFGPDGDKSAYGYVENNPLAKVDPQGLHSIFFDGNMIRVFDDKGALVLVCRGTSGVKGSTPSDQRHEFGPLPAGKYFIDPNEFSGGLVRSFFRGPAWGRCRIPLHPAVGTDTLGRHGVNPGDDPFFIHGSDHLGSAGCLNIGKCDIEFHNLLANHAGPIFVQVNYTQFRPF